MESMDSGSKISDQALASKMLRGSGLPQEKKAQVLINCGGIYDPSRLETVLRVTFPKIGDHERRQGTMPSRGDNKWKTSSGKFPSHRKPGARVQGKFGKHRVHEVEQLEGQEPEDAERASELEEDAAQDFYYVDPEDSEASEEDGGWRARRLGAGR